MTSSSVVNGSVTISSELDSYDADGNVLTSTDAAGNVTSNTYRGTELIQTRQLNATSATLNANYASYDANGNLASSTDGVGNITSNFFNGNEMTSSYVLSSSSVTISSEADTYDADGNLLTSSDGQGNVTTNVYNGNELVSTAVVHGLSTTLSSANNSYDSDGNLLTTTNAEGNVTTNVYNGDDRVISSTVATSSGTVNSSAAYTYDGDGKVLTTTDGDGNVTTNSWDGNLLRRATVTSASGTTIGVTYYSYDANGNLTSVTDPDGRTILSTYSDNRLVSQTWENADNAVANTLSWSYDSAGNLISASNNAGTYSMSYNGHELVSESGPNGVTLNYGYDAAGNVTSIVDSQGGTTSLTYGANGEVLTETYQDTSNHFRVNYTYDAAGNVLTETRYSDLAGTSEVGYTQNGYNGDEITSINQQNGSGTVLASYSYSYDNGGWLTSKVQNGVTTGYGYNADGELTLAGTQSYSYDQNGNSTKAGTTIGANNELLSDGTWKYSYDAAGNMTGQVGISNGLTWSYGYDDANEMTSAVETNSGGTIVEQGIYVYDVLGNRIEEVSVVSGTTTDQRYVYGADGTLYADLNGSNSITTRYVADSPMGVNHWQAAVSTSTGVNWLLSDYQGSVCDVVNNVGTLLCVTVYDAYGNITSQTNASNAGRLGFQGGQTDIVTGLEHFGAREYNSSTGRWNRIDPEGFAAGQSNLYEFAGNGPTDGTDPTGREVDPLYSAGNIKRAIEIIDRFEADPSNEKDSEDYDDLVAQVSKELKIEADDADLLVGAAYEEINRGIEQARQARAAQQAKAQEGAQFTEAVTESKAIEKAILGQQGKEAEIGDPFAKRTLIIIKNLRPDVYLWLMENNALITRRNTIGFLRLKSLFYYQQYGEKEDDGRAHIYINKNWDERDAAEHIIDVVEGAGLYEFGNEFKDWQQLNNYKGASEYYKRLGKAIASVGHAAGEIVAGAFLIASPTAGVLEVTGRAIDGELNYMDVLWLIPLARNAKVIFKEAGAGGKIIELTSEQVQEFRLTGGRSPSRSTSRPFANEAERNSYYEGYERIFGKGTAPKAPRGIKNGKLAGQKHLVTGVPFDKDGFPVFESHGNTTLPKNLIGPEISDTKQFQEATRQLWEQIKDNPARQRLFTPEQLEQIKRGDAYINGFTWHHHQDGETLQLVDRSIHSKTGHSGGRQTTGGRP